MRDRDAMQEILESHPEVEALLHIGASGLPQAWRMRGSEDPEQVSLLAMDLLRRAQRMSLLTGDAEPRLHLSLAHGRMILAPREDGSLLAVLTHRPGSDGAGEAALEKLILAL